MLIVIGMLTTNEEQSDSNIISSASNADPPLGVVVHDFAGAGVVHMVGGVAALVGAYMVGPRLGFFDDKGKPQVIPGQHRHPSISPIKIHYLAQVTRYS